MSEAKHIVVIGNGVSGITFANKLREFGDDSRITVISKETDHFYSRTALMYIYMGHMTYEQTKPYEDHHWQRQRIDLVRDTVDSIDAANKKLKLEGRGEMSYDTLVLALGAKSNRFDWPGQDLPGVQGLYNYQDLELMEANTRSVRHAVIIGGGLIGVEMAEMLLSRKIGVSFLIREGAYWSNVLPLDEAKMVSRYLRSHHVDLREESELEEIHANEQGDRVSHITTKSGNRIDCQFVGITVGVSPNVDFVRDGELEVDRGILINEYFETNLPDVYAIGDCAQFRYPLPGRRPVEQVWYTGKMHGEHLARTLSGQKTAYDPGIWFNSAKFFDIEYQTYGMVMPKLPDNEESFYWEHSDGEKCLRINFKKDTRQVTGFNFFGIRARHAICEDWIARSATVREVLEHLGASNFDPEFFVRHEEAILAKYNETYPQDRVELKSSKGLFSSYWKKFREGVMAK